MPYWKNVLHDYVSLPEPDYLAVMGLWVRFCDTFRDDQNVTQADLHALWEGFSGLRPLSINGTEDPGVGLVESGREADPVGDALLLLSRSTCVCACVLAVALATAGLVGLRHAGRAVRGRYFPKSSEV